MRRSVYKIIIAPIILSAVTIFIAYYSIGVVEKNDAVSSSLEHVSGVISNIYENHVEYEMMLEQLCSEYEMKAKTLSVIISQMPKTLSEDMTAEELRIASGADKISISDKNGLIIFSTSPNAEIEYVNDKFKNGLDKPNFSDTLITNSEQGCVFEVAVSRRSGKGLIIASFANYALNEVLSFSEISYPILAGSPSVHGITAITDENGIFKAHTNNFSVGTECPIPAERFEKEKGSFSFSFYGTPSLVCYKAYNESIIMHIVPKTDVYEKRDLLLIWMILLAVISNISVLLSIRQYRSEKNEEAK